MIGLCGSHRVGKSTLAKAFALRGSIPYVQTSGSEVFEILGKDPKIDYPIDVRIGIQEAILYAFELQYAKARSTATVWVADRTPIDIASYLVADIQRGTLAGDPGMSALVNGFVKRCIDSTNQWFSTVVLVQPGITVVEASGKAPGCPAYIEHISLIQTGLLLNEGLLARHYMVPRHIVDLDQRVEALMSATTHAIDLDQKKSKVKAPDGAYYQ